MKIDKHKKLVCNLKDKENYIIHIRALKQELNHGLIIEKVQRVTDFNREPWPKPCIDLDTEFGSKGKNDFDISVYLGLSIFDISIIAMYVYWNDYIKPKYGHNEKPCYTYKYSLIV